MQSPCSATYISRILHAAMVGVSHDLLYGLIHVPVPVRKFYLGSLEL